MAEFVLSTKGQMLTYYAGLQSDLVQVLKDKQWFIAEHNDSQEVLKRYDQSRDNILAEIERVDAFYKEHYLS